MRRFGSPPEIGTTHMHRPGAYAILPRGRRMLLTWQAGTQREYQLPGGGIDPGEQPIRALHREVFEETGWRIAGARHLGAFRRFVYMPEYGIHAEKVCHLYLARPVRRLADPTDPEHRPVWRDTAEVTRLLANPGDIWFVRHVLRIGRKGPISRV